MNDLSQIKLVFACYVIIILIIAYIGKYVTKNLADYILGNRKLSAPVTALGAGASDMSSWLTMALPGFIYTYGLSMIWMPLALILGAWSNWKFVAKRLRVYTEISQNALTLPSYLAERFNDHTKVLRVVTSLASVIFFTCYAAAGFLSGAILLQLIFKLDYITALWISSSVIIIYTAIGGFLAISWIDFFQGSLMLLALLIVPIATFNYLGGIKETIMMLKVTSSHTLEVWHNVNWLNVIACLAWGLGYFGQPHINVRFMAIKETKDLALARKICISWMSLSLLGAIATGLAGVGFYAKNPLNLPETVFITLSRELFQPWIAGILLSAVLASIMSTVSAQILVTTSIVINDLWPKKSKNPANTFKSLYYSKIIMLALALVAVGIAVKPKTILHAVGFAWAGLGAAFGPTILFSLYWRKMNVYGARCGVIVGMIAVVIIHVIFKNYNVLPGLSILPAFILSSLAIIIITKLTPPPPNHIVAQFDLMLSKIYV